MTGRTATRITAAERARNVTVSQDGCETSRREPRPERASCASRAGSVSAPRRLDRVPRRSPLSRVLFNSVMTLVVASVNSQDALVASDRKTSGRGGSERYNKALTLEADDCIIAMSFSGVATVGTEFDADQWIPEALAEAARRGTDDATRFTLASLIWELANVATERFSQLPKQAQGIETTFVGAGYRYLDKGWKRLRGVTVQVTNVDPDDSSKVTSRFTAMPPRFVSTHEQHVGSCVGTLDGLDQADIDAYSELVITRPHRDNLVGATVDLMRKVARDPRSKNLIGTDIMTTAFSPDSRTPVEHLFHAANTIENLPAPNNVILRSDRQLLVGNQHMFWRDPATGEITKHDPMPRPQEPCFCGSGYQYRHCHGSSRRKPFFQPPS